MLTSTQIRQQFLDFFREKKHTIVPSGSLMPDSPNLLFTNAGMNQFVPIFLGEIRCPYTPGRAADTQKCIRAGGKHNDLDDVGLDTYHHTFFEMLGNWSFGDYFKAEAIEWSWELIVERFHFPPNRVYATIYQPDPGDPSERDQEAYDLWAEKFRSVGLDPAIHIVNGNKKDNFWMMGETGPCGPCSEIHIDLTPEDRTPELEQRGAGMVNAGVPECIEIWNNVFIQFNAEPDGPEELAKMLRFEPWRQRFVPLPAKHVDTGMGFERLTSIIQGTKNFTDFKNAKISNYETDIFRPIFDELEKMSGERYGSTLPPHPGSTCVPHVGEGVPPSRTSEDGAESSSRRDAETNTRDACAPRNSDPEQIAQDIAFRVIADHIRTLSFAIADGISPGNTDRNYVLRRILRRAVRYGRTLGFREPFFYKLVAVLARTMGDVFPEIRAKQKHVEEVIRREEESFNKTLDKGIALFEAEAARLTGAPDVTRKKGSAGILPAESGILPGSSPDAGWKPADAGRMPALPGQSTSAPASAGNALGSAGFQPVPSGILPEGGSGARYWKRRLPHYERPHGIYHLTFSTKDRRILSPTARQTVLDALVHFDRERYELFAACVMPDHVHVLFQPSAREGDAQGNPVFWSLAELMHSVKSFTSTKINKAEGTVGQQLWENEYHDRLMRSDADVEEKFQYVCGNPWAENIVGPEESYPWLWTWNDRAALPTQGGEAGRQDAGQSGLEARAPQAPTATTALTGSAGFQPAASGILPGASAAASRAISGAFAFRLYDEQGFPLDLTELMARERGLTVDTAGFEKHMEEQRARARAAQKKTVIELSEIETKEATTFLGYDQLSTPAKVLEVVALKDKTAVILDTTTAYAEMGGQVGDTGELSRGADAWRITNTQKSGATWLHFLEGVDAPDVGAEVVLGVEVLRRRAIERHHSVTHLLHWALHEVVSREATQKGSFVGPDKLTFDFNSAALTPQQVRDIERLVNERIVENARVAWTEVPYAEVKGRADIMQFFGDKYGETVRLVDIGGYSKELCAGTHTRATGEIGLFRIHSEAAIAAGVRRIEAVAGLTAYDEVRGIIGCMDRLSGFLKTQVTELEHRVTDLVEENKKWQKVQESWIKREGATYVKTHCRPEVINGTPAWIHRLPLHEHGIVLVQSVLDALKTQEFQGVAVLGGIDSTNSVQLAAYVSPTFTAKAQAGKIIGAIAPLVGGKGGGKPDNARGGGKDPSQLDAALAHARTLLG